MKKQEPIKKNIKMDETFDVSVTVRNNGNVHHVFIPATKPDNMYDHEVKAFLRNAVSPELQENGIIEDLNDIETITFKRTTK